MLGVVQILFLFPGVAYKLSSDDRVFTDPDELTSDSIITNEISLQSNWTCQTHKVYLKVSREAWHVCAAMYVYKICVIAILNCGMLLGEVVTNFLLN